jgi:hypothetical protein
MQDITSIWRFDLTKGRSKHPRNGACVMSAVSWLTDGTLNDKPSCVSPVIAELCQFLNDEMPDDERQRLKVSIPSSSAASIPRTSNAAAISSTAKRGRSTPASPMLWLISSPICLVRSMKRLR